ncbi:leucine-rich repeat domain-containing protein, partial [Aduncisulcus paluster]
ALADLDFIDSLPNLVFLEIVNCYLLDISKLSQVKNTLEHFSISYGEIIYSMSVLSELTNLKYLELSNVTTYAPNLPDLSSLTALKHLDLHALQRDVGWDISWISSLPNLEYLDLCEATIQDFSASLGFQSYDESPCSTLPDMSNLPNLQNLEMECTSLDDSDLQNISQLVNLEILQLELNSAITDISSLSPLSSLKALIISDGYHLLDMSVPSLPSLEYLSLPSSTDTVLPDLSSVPKLRVFSWIENSISDYSNLSTATALQSLNISHCALIDGTQLSSILSSLSGLNDLTISVYNPDSATFDLSLVRSLKYLNVSGTWSDMSEAILPPNVRKLYLYA